MAWGVGRSQGVKNSTNLIVSGLCLLPFLLIYLP